MEPWVLDVLDDTLTNHHPAHTRVRNGHVLRCPDNVVRTEELERPRLGEKVLVPLLDGCKVLKILHHIETGSDVVWRLEQIEKVIGLKDNVRIDPHHGVVINLALERLLVLALEHITSETLGTCKMHNRGILLRNHNLVSLGGRLHNEFGPAQKKLTRIGASGHAKDDLHLSVLKKEGIS